MTTTTQFDRSKERTWVKNEIQKSIKQHLKTPDETLTDGYNYLLGLETRALIDGFVKCHQTKRMHIPDGDTREPHPFVKQFLT
ncbi:hypothetical protein OU789_02625 [Halocynthiibacter sp. C4]|uniref:hypothetical protein n=1 Tax=Halocynthiibacter sp. C4 TaxID=2992758 RepID=UPI00237BF3B8|nr:hypothetical protein [Halocynthiibacter sp. C4]MDE0588817.1 hypothetical protein [Halocynthiibacter sp. C4]